MFNRRLFSSKVPFTVAFKYGLARRLAEESLRAVSSMFLPSSWCQPLEVIMPYGFEFLSLKAPENRPYWPPMPQRHYPAIGYPRSLGRETAECIAQCFQGVYLNNLYKHYPWFHGVLKYIAIHRNGRYLRLTPEEVETPTHLEQWHVMHIELFPLKKGQTMLEHYANYLTCLFGSFMEENDNLPEIKEFHLSKTRRNRLFQLYLMCDALSGQLLQEQEVLCLTEKQQVLHESLFQQLRIQNPSELIIEVKTQPMAMLPIEEEIVEQLIWPRMAYLEAQLKRSLPNHSMVTLTSPPYYDGESPLTVTLPEPIVDQIKALAYQTYGAFPQDVENHSSSGQNSSQSRLRVK